MKKIRVVFVCLICLWLTADASALDINLLSESYHVAGYIQAGATVLDSFDYSGSCPLTGDVSYVVAHGEGSNGEGSASRFQVNNYLNAPLGIFPEFYPSGINWYDIDVYGLAEATWSFQTLAPGDQTFALNLTNIGAYYDGSTDDKAAFVSITRNGVLYDSFYVPFYAFNLASEITLAGNTPGDIWELTFKTENLVRVADRARASISADLHAVPEPSTILLIGAGLAGLASVRKRLRR